MPTITGTATEIVIMNSFPTMYITNNITHNATYIVAIMIFAKVPIT